MLLFWRLVYVNYMWAHTNNIEREWRDVRSLVQMRTKVNHLRHFHRVMLLKRLNTRKQRNHTFEMLLVKLRKIEDWKLDKRQRVYRIQRASSLRAAAALAWVRYGQAVHYLHHVPGMGQRLRAHTVAHIALFLRNCI